MAKERSILCILLKIPSGNFRKYLYISVMNFKDVNFYARIICFRNLNIYEVCVSDRMHHIDLGLFKYQLEFTQEILKKVGGLELQKIFNERLRHIPRFPGLKLLSKVGQLQVMIASNYRHIMKIVIFAFG
jgi:hypothetical protein